MRQKGEKMANKKILLGKTEVSETSAPYFIAEIGINHNGDLDLAKRLIDAAYATGWNCAKFQKREPDIAVPEAQKSVMRETPWGTMTYLDYKKRIEFGKQEYDYIDSYCKEKPISWTASPWDIPSLEFLLQYDVPFIKIASAGNGNEELIREACKANKPIILSDGMCTMEELDKTVSWIEKYGNGDYILLHTNSTYPAPVEELNIAFMETMRKRYNCLVGYSGHEQMLEPTVVATVMGAKVIERHITISHDMWGTDQKASLEICAMDILYKRCMTSLQAIGVGETKAFGEGEQAKRGTLRS
jgi:N-acetylneuraminate synthase